MLASNAPHGPSPDPASTAEMPRLMIALGIEPAAVHFDHPALYASMESVCAGCGTKETCRRHLSEGVAAEHASDYCGNAATLSLLANRAEFSRD